MGYMYQKEVDRSRSWNTRGQITLFIIVGLVILFSFLMVIQLTDSVAKGKLKQEQEKVMSGGFRKEALRLFVEACLEKSLEDGLVLIGRQGTIWSDQPGGTKGFAPGVTGVEDPETGTKVAYGITRKSYSDNNMYPCDEDGDPCTYTYPDTTKRFGVLSLTDVTEDLRLYLKEETYACVNDFVEKKISSSAVVEREELDIQLEMRNDGISIQANYPLKFSLSGEEFFYLSRFDFVYKTDFKKFYRSAVEFPFQQDYNFVDYDLSHEKLLVDPFDYKSERDRGSLGMSPLCDLIRDSPLLGKFNCHRTTFASTYKDLGVEMVIKHSADGANDIFEYTVPGGIIKNQLYTFRMARQNRPPALDYVSRKECPAFGYDYLVIKGKEGFNTIDTTLLAHDPDEDATLTYSFSSTDIPLAATTSDRLVIDEDVILPLDPKIYTITATAKDSHNTEDKQDVQVLVDNELSTTLSFDFPYNDVQSLHGTTYYISKEDPIFLKLKFPQPRFNGDVGTATLSTTDGNDWDLVSLPSGTQLQGDLLYPLPSDPTRVTLIPGADHLTTYYNQEKDIENIRGFQTNPFVTKGSRLDLSLNYEYKYCGEDEQTQTSTSSAITYVVDCVPHRNAEAKSYPYHGNTNAFLADHTCCLGQPENPATWNIAAAGTTCYINPSLGCYGTMVGSGKYVAAYEGYVLEKQFGVCDGVRGNTCTDKKGEFVDGPLLCGGIGDPSCKISGTNPIDSNCYDQSAWGLVADPDGADSKLPGWCYGTMGCTQFCSLEQGESIVQVDETIPTPKDNALNTYVKQNFVQDLNGKLDCGCKREYLGKKCDVSFDGEFEGTCQPEGGTYKCKI